MKPNNSVAWVKFTKMERFMTAVFKAVGVPEDEAKICADVLITADKRGIDSHGIGRLKTIYYDRIKDGVQFAKTNFEIIRETSAIAVVDAHHGMGMVAAQRSMKMAIKKAAKYGIGMVAVRNSTHFGACCYYALMAIEQGMIGIIGTNARPSIAPTFGVENMLGTNPLVFGMPTDEDFPFVLDCATAVSQRGKIEVYHRSGKTIPPGWVISENGQTRTDTSQILKDLVKGSCALVPLGGIGEETAGYKGYGYATVVEMLSAALQGGAYLKMLSGLEDGKKAPYRLGHFFIAIDVKAFVDLAEFKKITGNICRELRSSKKMPGAKRIYTAGEKEHLAWLARKDLGIPVPKTLQREMVTMRDELGLNRYKFKFE